LNSNVRAQLLKALRSVVRELREFAYARPIPSVRGAKPGRRPRLGLALGGGFARAFAHIGVLKVLVDNHIVIDALAGTSAGSIVAAAFASGCTIEEMASAARNTRWNSFARWTFPRQGFATNERMESLLVKTLHCRSFEQLKIPLAVVAADILSGETVIFREGDLITPLRASCSFPGLFVPIEYGGRLLIDGAVAASVPVSALPDMDLIVGVHVQCNSLRQRPTNLFEIVGESFRITQDLNLAGWRDRCDLSIEPRLVDFRWDDFARAEELIAAGEIAAKEALPALRNLNQERAQGFAAQPPARAAGPRFAYQGPKTSP